MLPKIASALARVLNPIKPIERPAGVHSLAKSADGSEGGYSPAGYESPEKKKEREEAPSKNASDSAPLAEDGYVPPSGEKHLPSIPFQPGLTQMILELNATRTERSGETAARSYETGAKAQKKNSRLPKGTMLDKKVA